jgi:hypothetical protein
MIFMHFTPRGRRRVADLQDIFCGQTAMLVGGAPSLKEQPIELLNQRGVLTMAINNAACHFRPTMWISGDHPDCYEPQILLDPRIMKFAPSRHVKVPVAGRPYATLPNMFFYTVEGNVPWDEYLSQRPTVPWYNNTLFVAIHTLYRMGVRRIILAGSDFGFAKESGDADMEAGDMYAHKTTLGTLERKWNLDLYNSLVKELRLLKPLFDKAGLTLMDCSKNSRISQVYEHISLERAVELCLNGYPKKMVDPSTLPHCSKFAPESIQQRIAKWPGHQLIGLPPDPIDSSDDKREMEEIL